MAKFLFNNYYKYFRVIKYLIAGGTATSVNLILLYLLTEYAHLWYLVSSALAFIISFFVSFYLQKYWTFTDRDKEKVFKQLSIYLLVALINLVINLVIMYLLVEIVGFWYMLAQLITGALIATESYLIYNFFIFNQVPNKTSLTKGNGSAIKVLIATGIYPPDIGGPATMLEAMANCLQENKLAVKVITYSGGKAGKNDRIMVYRIKRGKLKFINNLKYFWRLLELASWADLIYVTDTYSVGYFSYLIKKYFGRRYIVRFAGDSAWETAVGAGWINDYLIDFLEKKYNDKIESLKQRREKILINADKVIVVSRFLATVAERIGVKADKLRMIYNAIDFEQPEERSDHEVKNWHDEFGSGAKIIMTACRLTPWKGVDGIIKILAELNEKIGRVFLLVLGDGPELNKLRYLARERQMGDRVIFLGRIDNRRILDYFKTADLFILNSNYEGLSHTLLEAMTAGVPIIASKVGGNPEVICDGREGLLVDYNNEEQLAGAAYKILTDRMLAERLTANAKVKLSLFNWQNTVAQTITTIKSVSYEKSDPNQSTV